MSNLELKQSKLIKTMIRILDITLFGYQIFNTYRKNLDANTIIISMLDITSFYMNTFGISIIYISIPGHNTPVSNNNYYK